ncbi:MAG TPA: SMP-30/gluconolactonase/LRE family protein [Acidimicrobiales bacterium]|nr:SMP-30/gluconolactonase/LRE family protein [Acidimicrobiales bacterium]
MLVFDADGNRDVVARVEGLPFSIDWLPDGRLVATTPGGLVAGPDLEPYGANAQPFNEIVVDAAGRAWVDMPGSMPWGEPKPGIVTVVLPDGSSRQVADDVWFPNGMVVLGEDTLVLAESHADRLTAWTITDSGELVDRRVWADLGPGSAPDGICADAEGAIWYASVPGQRCTRVAEGGEVLDTVMADRGCFSCMLGGDDGRTLTSWPTTGARAAPRTVSSWSTRSPYRTPGAPDKPRHRRDATHRPPTPGRPQPPAPVVSVGRNSQRRRTPRTSLPR